MKTIAIVIQRYGQDVNGGAEYHARILAEQLCKMYHVNILTTTALDYYTWDNYYPSGETIINSIPVLRFPTQSFSPKQKRKITRIITNKRKYFKILKLLKLFNFFNKHLNITQITQKDIDNWLAIQGPYCPDLIHFIKESHARYDAFIFFTYLYYPTAVGMPLVKEKSIFIPTAHDEPILYIKAYENIFSIPKFIMYNTEAERKIIEDHFDNTVKNNDVAGVGINNYQGIIENLPDELISKKYFVYIGRIDISKGCKSMLDFFISFKNKNPNNNCKLLLIGKDFMKKKAYHPDIIYTGFVHEETKYSLLKNALAMIMPSPYESLSLVTLEAMIEEIPVIVNGNCEVLLEHHRKSGTGDFYYNQNDFEKALLSYLSKTKEELYEEGIKAKKYVTENYTWDKVLIKFKKAIDFICSS